MCVYGVLDKNSRIYCIVSYSNRDILRDGPGIEDLV